MSKTYPSNTLHIFYPHDYLYFNISQIVFMSLLLILLSISDLTFCIITFQDEKYHLL